MYIASKPLEWDLGEIPLRRTIQHVGIGSTFFIDMKKYQTTKRKAITLAIIAFIIMGLSIAIGEHYNRADHELYASFFFIAPIAELYGLYQLDKVISKKALKKYHHALLKIDATHFAYQAN
ncbi:TPA: hypothetical protein VEO38_001845 [Providencia alcalifaciens]|nr:hypothetical protein [Providencia alcalifaciens]